MLAEYRYCPVCKKETGHSDAGHEFDVRCSVCGTDPLTADRLIAGEYLRGERDNELLQPSERTCMNDTPRIVSAAMLMDDGLIVTGVRHFSPDMRATLRRIYGNGFKLFGVWLKKPYHMRVKDQGFIDASGAYLDREDAWTIAQSHGQIIEYVAPIGTLFSENLY